MGELSYVHDLSFVCRLFGNRVIGTVIADLPTDRNTYFSPLSTTMLQQVYYKCILLSREIAKNYHHFLQIQYPVSPSREMEANCHRSRAIGGGIVTGQEHQSELDEERRELAEKSTSRDRSNRAKPPVLLKRSSGSRAAHDAGSKTDVHADTNIRHTILKRLKENGPEAAVVYQNISDTNNCISRTNFIDNLYPEFCSPRHQRHR
jgi:hypothetical protein